MAVSGDIGRRTGGCAMRHGRIGLVVVSCSMLIGVVACSDDASDQAEDAVDAVEEQVGEAGARAGAEAFRASLGTQDVDDASGGRRNVEVLQAAADDLPGDPEVTGIEDGDGDGVDDDGYVQFVVGDESACVEVPESGDEVDVTGGDCPSG